MTLRLIALAAASIALLGCSHWNWGAEEPLRVLVFQNGDEYMEYAQSCLDTIASMENVTGGLIDGAGVRSGGLEGVDVLIFPGGSGSAQSGGLGHDGGKMVELFAESGGGVIGICAGGYSLIQGTGTSANVQLVDADLLDDEHWARGIGDVMVAPATEGAEPFEVLYYNGPLWLPAGKSDVPDYAVLATFASDMHVGDAPEGVMPGTPAIIAAPFGEGRVVLFSPHPERTPGREWMLRSAVRWVAGGQVETDEITWGAVFGE